VLETLAERIADGEVDDLITRLPLPLHAALKRDMARSPGAPRMSLDRFLDRVAEREGVTPEQARTDARAVFITLREAVGDEEFFDITVQLPPEYAVLWVRQTGGMDDLSARIRNVGGALWPVSTAPSSRGPPCAGQPARRRLTMPSWRR
jgi:uncharacterized protein (DUF2267 family)